MRSVRKGGFTFVETLLAVIMIGVIASVAAQVLVTGLDVYALIVNRNNAYENARIAMDRMTEEILQIDSMDITWMSGTRLGFIDGDGHSTDFERVTVSRNGRSVPCINRGDDYLAGDVTSLAFHYYRETGASTIWSWEVRRINIDLTVTALANAGTVHLTTDVFPRRFMYSNFQ